MYQELPFNEWFAQVKIAFEREGLSLPEDIELMDLAHMECAAEQKSIEEFVKEEVRLQKGA